MSKWILGCVNLCVLSSMVYLSFAIFLAGENHHECELQRLICVRYLQTVSN